MTLYLQKEVALEHDVSRQCQHTLQRLLDTVQLLALFTHRTAEADCAAALWIAPVECDERLFYVMSTNDSCTLLSRLPRQVVLPEQLALAERESTIMHID